MLPMTEEEAAWRRSWLKKQGKEPSDWNWLDAGAAYRDHLRDLRDSNLSDLSNPPNPQDQRAGASPAPMHPVVGRIILTKEYK